MTGFDETVRDEIWKILTMRYRTVRHGGHPTDAEEHLQERKFWPDMEFRAVTATEGPNGGQVRITFSPVREPELVFGYKIDVDSTAAAWSKRIGIRDPYKSPTMFAAELIWYMVAYIGSHRIDEVTADPDGIRWINRGDDVFAPLPEPLAFQHEQHAEA